MNTSIPMASVCGHCFTHSSFVVKGEYFLGTEEDDYEIRIMSEYTFRYFQFQVLECESCKELTVRKINVREVGYDDAKFEPIYEHRIKILYPIRGVVLSQLPHSIEHEYVKAVGKLRVNEWDVCAMYVGRTLEAICLHEQVEGETLFKKIENLVMSGRLPKSLAQVAHQSRQIRNLGVHKDVEGIRFLDIVYTIEFINILLEYLYVMSPKVDAIQEKLKSQRLSSFNY